MYHNKYGSWTHSTEGIFIFAVSEKKVSKAACLSAPFFVSNLCAKDSRHCLSTLLSWFSLTSKDISSWFLSGMEAKTKSLVLRIINFLPNIISSSCRLDCPEESQPKWEVLPSQYLLEYSMKLPKNLLSIKVSWLYSSEGRDRAGVPLRSITLLAIFAIFVAAWVPAKWKFLIYEILVLESFKTTRRILMKFCMHIEYVWETSTSIFHTPQY